MSLTRKILTCCWTSLKFPWSWNHGQGELTIKFKVMGFDCVVTLNTSIAQIIHRDPCKAMRRERSFNLASADRKVMYKVTVQIWNKKNLRWNSCSDEKTKPVWRINVSTKKTLTIFFISAKQRVLWMFLVLWCCEYVNCSAEGNGFWKIVLSWYLFGFVGSIGMKFFFVLISFRKFTEELFETVYQ